MELRGIVRAAGMAAAVVWSVGWLGCGKKVAHTAESAASQTGSFTDTRDGQTYKTVKIGNQTWFAQNLNYRTLSAPGYHSNCYDGADSNCVKYGRLYSWSAAADVCPDGYHLPSREEWDILVKTAGGRRVAAKKLKAKNGWDNKENGSSGNGTDDYGFSAIPGGYVLYVYRVGKFDVADAYGIWWTDTEHSDFRAHSRSMYYNDNRVGEAQAGTGNAFSVRCVQDGGFEKSSVYFTDSRDGRSYRVVKIGGMLWMAENLKYQPKSGGFWCYDDDDYNCDKYGLLYTWSTAMKACPAGYHLPSSEEWDKLVKIAGGEDVAGEKLKARTGWNGTDKYGFSALPGGGYYNGTFKNIGDGGDWWAATMIDCSTCYGHYAWSRDMGSRYDDVLDNTNTKSSGLSVRCVADAK